MHTWGDACLVAHVLQQANRCATYARPRLKWSAISAKDLEIGLCAKHCGDFKTVESTHVQPRNFSLRSTPVLCQIMHPRREMHPLACRKKHPPKKDASINPTLKHFGGYSYRTSTNKWSKFHVCDTFIVRDSKGCISWQPGCS